MKGPRKNSYRQCIHSWSSSFPFYFYYLSHRREDLVTIMICWKKTFNSRIPLCLNCLIWKKKSCYYASYTFQGCIKDIKEVSNLKMGMHQYFHKFHIICGITKLIPSAIHCHLFSEKSHGNITMSFREPTIRYLNLEEAITLPCINRYWSDCWAPVC